MYTGIDLFTGQFIYDPGTPIQSLARFFNPNTVKTGHCHLKRAELRVKSGKGRLCPFSARLGMP